MFKFLQGVSFAKGKIHFHKTDVYIPMNADFWYQVWKISSLHTVIKLSKFWRAVTGRLPNKKIAFFPQRAGPWYNARIAAEMAGYKTVNRPEDADYHFVFSDDTYTVLSDSQKNRLNPKALNQNAVDISKAKVGEVFEEIFGYGLTVDPLNFKGEAVAKSEINGKHDGRIITCPIPPSSLEENCAYQRLIPTGRNADYTEDLRLLYIIGKPQIVFHKLKETQKQFGTDYFKVTPIAPDTVFSAQELSLITKFCNAIGLDFGALDVLRSTSDGRIYIVDVNKTGMPVMCLPLKAQYKAFQNIAKQFKAGLEQIE